MKIPTQPPDYNEILSKRALELVRVYADSNYVGVSTRIEAKYRHWDKVRFIARQESLDAELLWAMVKMGRLTRTKYLPLVGSTGHAIAYTVPDIVQQELMHIDQQLAGRLESEDDQPFNASDDERYVLSALREEAIASSMLEGAATTRVDAKRMLNEGRRPRTHGEQMVYNNFQAIEFIRENRKSPLSPELLLEIQSIITDKTLEDPAQAGRLREAHEKVRVVDPYGEVLHDPPPATELPNRLELLCGLANQTDGPFLHPVLRASALHFQIAFDHPFCDGNGRTARAIFYWSMLRAGYWLFEYLPISRYIYKSHSRYGRAFLYTETDSFDLTYFFAYKASVIRQVRTSLKQYLFKKRNEVVQARGDFEKDYRLNHRQRSLIMRFIRDPESRVNIALHRGRCAIAYGTARSDLLDLAEWGYLQKHEHGNRFEFSTGPKLSGDSP